MRSSSDTCRLCEKMKTTKKNSHIIPKFLANTLFGQKHDKKGTLIQTRKK